MILDFGCVSDMRSFVDDKRHLQSPKRGKQIVVISQLFAETEFGTVDKEKTVADT